MLSNKLMGFSGPAEIPLVEDVFSTYLYPGTGAAQTITNDINLSDKGGMVWIKNRSNGDHAIYDTARGATYDLTSNSTAAQTTETTGLTNFNSTGFSIGGLAKLNTSGSPYISWTFRKAPKFFDVVTFTATSGVDAVVNHSLGATPGMIVIKQTNSTSNWYVYHRALSTPNSQYLVLNTTAAATTFANWITTSTSSFTLPSADGFGGTYVAYLFAHDTATDGFIQCGSYTGNGADAGPIVSLGWEPQYVLVKNASGAGNWCILSSTPYMTSVYNDNFLYANSSTPVTSANYLDPKPTGFQIRGTATEINASGSNYIYMVIRRGPMRVPTDGNKIFKPVSRSGTGVSPIYVETTIQPDTVFYTNASSSAWGWEIHNRLLGGEPLYSESTNGFNGGYTNPFHGPYQTKTTIYGASSIENRTGNTYIHLCFKQAPNFHTAVCYTGTGAAMNQSHNLGVAPELIIVKRYDPGTTDNWYVYSSALTNSHLGWLNLNLPNARFDSTGMWNMTNPTASQFSIGSTISTSGAGYVALLFASCPGVSKVGSYTGNGSSQTISCGFTAGSRFILIKRTDNSGDWYVWNSASGIRDTTEPHASLNTTAASVTDDSVDPDSTGFIVNQVAATNVNVSAATYIYLAIA